jgi:hypothetical protein
MVWHHTTSPKRKKPKTVPLSGKVMGTAFWGIRGCILVDFLEKREMITAACYIQKLNKLLHALCEKRLKKKTLTLNMTM